MAALAVGAAWAVLILAWDEGPFALTFDDAWYYFEIGGRIAAGEGSTFDGINETNGYHPLWMGVVVLFEIAGTEAMTTVRALLVLQALLWAAALALVATVVRGAGDDDWPRLRSRERTEASGACEWTVIGALVVVGLNPFVARMAVNGLESALVVVTGAALVAAAHRGPGTLVVDRSLRWRWGFGLLLALAFLARTDAVFTVATAGFAAGVEVRAHRRDGRDAAWSSVAPLLIPAGATTAAFLVVNQAAFGTPVQVSGLVKRADPTLTTVVVVGAAGALACWSLVRSAARRQRQAAGETTRLARTSAYTARTGWYGAAAALLAVYYQVLQTQRWLWYFAPLAVWVVGLLLVGVADLAEGAVVESRADTSPTRALFPVQLIVGIPLVAGLLLTARTFADPELRSIQLANRRAGEWISANLPDDAVLASWDAGVLGYFTDQPVVNIDGVVNSLAWYRATTEGPEAVGAFLDRAGVTHIANHGQPVEGQDPTVIDYVTRVHGAERADALELVERFPFIYSGATTGSGGRQSGRRELAVFVYALGPP